MTEPRSVWDGLAVYSRFYAPGAILVFCFSFGDLFEDRVDNNRLTHFGSMWEIAATRDGGPVILGIVLMLALVALLVRMSVRTSHSAGWPGAVLALLGVALIMLYVRPGTGSPRPELANGGAILTALVFALLVVSVVHLGHLARIRALLAAQRH